MGKRTLLTAFIACLILSACQTTRDTPVQAVPLDRLKPPFDIVQSREQMGLSRTAKTSCKSPPEPVRDLTFDGIYRKGTGSSVVDRDAMRRYRALRKPIDDFERYVIKQSDRYVANRPANPDRAACVLNWLDHWARAGAYLGDVSQQGGFVRKWSLGTISLAYLKVRDAQGLDPTQKKTIEDWVGKWARVVHDDYATDLHRSSRNNNHAYWAAWSVGLAAVVLNDRQLFDWMVDRYHRALRQIGPDGTLPLELKRGSKALHYHVFSSQALVLIAELGRRNGSDLYEANDGALKRLIKRTTEGLADPGYFAEKTGKNQNWVGKLNGSKLAWMEPYYARFRDPAIRPWIKRFRPLKNRRIGGDATLLYGVKELD
jgi:poly(beta-D-mannuronate) lyase